jgi:hypothetical protein
MAQSRTLAGLVIGLTLTLAVSAQADPVTHWHAIATTAVNAGRPGPPGLLDYALVQVAVHDAVQAIEGQYQPYHYSDPTRLGRGSTAAAAAAATYHTLVLLYGAKPMLDADYASFIAANNLAGDDGLATGAAAAAAVHSRHYRPLIAVANPSKGNEAIGQWRSPVVMGFQFLAESTPFTLKRVDQFRPQPPPPLTSMRYARDFAEVQEAGRNSSQHPDTDMAWFWAGNFTVQWNEAVRQIADTYLTTSGERARLLALANLAAADAAMAVWESKVFYNIWRPSTAIAFAGDDPNPRTEVSEGTWVPLFVNNPPYPDYVSGANGLTGAFTGMLRLVLGRDDVSFTISTPSAIVVDKVRDFTSISQAAQEVVDARVLLGIHFRFADEEGRRLGERVAHWAFQKYLRPVHGNR